ncbi:MAG: glutamine-hydrolyzing GMP synthase [Candidatus Asgardarchaeia archaeon]
MIAIIDFHGQYVHVISNRLAELGVENRSIRTFEELKSLDDLKGIILSGGPYSVYDKNAKLIDKRIFDLGVPILGICYGHQLIAYLLGGEVKQGTAEFGFALFRPKKDPLFDGLSNEEIVWMSHRDEVFSVPNATILGSTDSCKIAAFKLEKDIYGVQFHPEVSHTVNGDQIFKNFAFKICGEHKKPWNVKKYLDEAITALQSTVTDGTAILGLSGGVDSATCAALAKKAGIDVHVVYVDHGFMRYEDEWIKKTNLFDVNYIDASDVFFEAVKNVLDPDERRRKIGQLFVEYFEKEAKRANAKYLIQGTIAPDVIESTRGDDVSGSGFIKLHHNVGGLPEKLNLKIIEPLRPLFKYQVRILAKELGLPNHVVNRQPFPGPGLAVRIVGKITKTRIKVLKEITNIVTLVLSKYSYSQYFASLIENRGRKISEGYIFKAKTIGVKGDSRVFGNILSIERPNSASYFDLLKIQSKLTSKYSDVTRVVIRVAGTYGRGDAIIIRAVNTKDFMTATPADVPWFELEKIAKFALSYNSINFVGYEITTKPPSTIELI